MGCGLRCGVQVLGVVKGGQGSFGVLNRQSPRRSQTLKAGKPKTTESAKRALSTSEDLHPLRFGREVFQVRAFFRICSVSECSVKLRGVLFSRVLGLQGFGALGIRQVSATYGSEKNLLGLSRSRSLGFRI